MILPTQQEEWPAAPNGNNVESVFLSPTSLARSTGFSRRAGMDLKFEISDHSLEGCATRPSGVSDAGYTRSIASP
jgi:hypothetical protein